MNINKSLARSWALIAISEPGLDVNSITRELGIEPDFALAKDTLAISGEKISTPLWQIHSKKEAFSPLEDHVWELISRIAPNRKEFQKICQKHKVILYCSIEFNDGNKDEVSLSPKTLLLLGDLGVNLCFQGWKLPEERRRLDDQH
ncbi:hypothetical protein CH373_07615 [Leptospira perolatii]|uniref:DUF4279 domain-containing protein n=1 Tax=Leptospira perolatii TaxID=2023191 RepID=A0A2M9ZQ68_9LEPT|nr:DUF4279 domain-containing protein [Leptospira perolatii]PJZ70947.1 hypothetical protein CH360_04475 [Leptospira perolatii]PJZ74073.1 hypothetical protein CH373_07615 [Leptospira perolatii]